MMRKRICAINCVSLIPHTLMGPAHTVEIAVKSGFDGIQLLPLRGWPYRKILTIRDHIVSQENAWQQYQNNNGSLLKAIMSTLRNIKSPEFRLGEWLIFNKSTLPPIPGALQCTNIPLDLTGYVLEVSEETSTDLKLYETWVKEGYKFCIDTNHLDRPHRINGLKIGGGDWDKTLKIFPKGSIGLIHIRPRDKKELNLFMNGKPCALLDKIEALSGITSIDVPWVLEIAPRLRSKKNLIKYLSLLRQKVSKILDDVEA